MDNRLSAMAVKEYQLEKLMEATERHFSALGIWETLSPGMRVTLKPNLLMKRTPDRATTTHPLVVEAVARVLQNHGIKEITLADSPGGLYSVSLLEGIYKATGMMEVAKRTGIKLNLDTSWRELHCEQGVLSRSFEIIAPIADADYIINLPKLKTHVQMTLSAGCKNLFGCIPGLRKPELHYRFPAKEDFGRMLVDLSLLVSPGVTLVDAVESMEGDGPSSGMPRGTGMTFAACNVHTLDLGICHWIGLEVDPVYPLRHAVDSGLCPSDSKDIVWLGEKPDILTDWKLPASSILAFSDGIPHIFRGLAQRIERRVLSPRPSVSKKVCIGCGKCAESCVPRAMKIEKGKAELTLTQCIRCYCCHEMCPVGAISIRRFRLLKM